MKIHVSLTNVTWLHVNCLLTLLNISSVFIIIIRHSLLLVIQPKFTILGPHMSSRHVSHDLGFFMVYWLLKILPFFSWPVQFFHCNTTKVTVFCPHIKVRGYIFDLNFISTEFQFHSSWLCRRQARHRSVSTDSTFVIYVFIMRVPVIVW